MGWLKNLLLYLGIATVCSACGGGSSGLTTSNGSGNGAGGAANITYGSTTLSWIAPTTWADNTAASLSAIAGYRLYYGSTPTTTYNYINIANGAATQYTITLPSGTYYFRISAIDTKGFEGLRSTALEKTL